jgi:hypothetical protein
MKSGKPPHAVSRKSATRALWTHSCRLLNDNDQEVRQAGGAAIRTLRGAAGELDPLVAALDDDADERRKAAPAALRTRGWRPTTDYERVRFALNLGEWDELAAMGTAAVEPLIAVVGQSADADTIRMLGKTGVRRASRHAESSRWTDADLHPLREAILSFVFLSGLES